MRYLIILLLISPCVIWSQIDPFQQKQLDKVYVLLGQESYDAALGILEDIAEENGIPASMVLQSGLLPASLDKSLLQSVLLYRGMAHEGIGEFAEAKNNYAAYLATTPATEVSAELQGRMQAINTAASTYLAQLSVQNEAKFNRFYQGVTDSMSIGILPFFNSTKNPNVGRVGYGIAGFLSATFAILPQYLDLSVKIVERSQLNAALNELTLAKFYESSASPKVAKILSARFILSGTLQEEGKELIAQATLLDLQSRCTKVLNPVKVEATDQGVRVLQAELNRLSVDALQNCFGTKGDRFVYDQAVMPLYIGQFQQIQLYGEALELAAFGDIRRSNKLFSQSGVSIAQQDLQYLHNVRANQAEKRTESRSAGLSQFSNAMASSALGAAGISTEDSTTPTQDSMGALPAALNPNLQALLVRIKIPLPLPPIR